MVVTLSADGGQIEGPVDDERAQPPRSVMVTLIAVGTRSDDLLKTATVDDASQPGSIQAYVWTTERKRLADFAWALKRRAGI